MNKTRKFACGVVAEIAHGFNDLDRQLPMLRSTGRGLHANDTQNVALALLESNTEALRKKPWSCIR